MIRIISGWVAAVLATYIFSTGSSQAVILIQTATEPVTFSVNPSIVSTVGLPLSMAVASIGDAILHMHQLLPVIAIGLGIGFLVAAVLKKILVPLASIAYPAAGAVAMLTPLLLMKNVFGVFPILGAQTSTGLVLQIVAGIFGGLIFSHIIRREV